MSKPIRTFMTGEAKVYIFQDRSIAGAAAAEEASLIIKEAISKRGKARIIVATGNSQLDVIDSLASSHDIPWEQVEAFHMDEYVGISKDHSASFRLWLKEHLAKNKNLAAMHYLQGDAENIDVETKRYAELLTAESIDLAFVGIGENGHIAFNEPNLADFEDPQVLKVITLEEKSLKQQVGEGHFTDIESVPKTAITITCSGLLSAENWICCVPEKRKAAAIKSSLEGEVSTNCPGSVVQIKPNTKIFLDVESASLLS